MKEIKSAEGTQLRVAEFSGTVTLKDENGNQLSPRKQMPLYSGYSLATAAGSALFVSLDGTGVVKLDASGAAKVAASGKKLAITLVSGKLFSGDEGGSGGAVRTSSTVAGVRG